MMLDEWWNVRWIKDEVGVGGRRRGTRRPRVGPAFCGVYESDGE